MHTAGAPLNLDGENQSQKSFSSWPGLSLDLVHKHLTKKTINHTWAPPETTKSPQINTGKGYAPMAISRTITVPTIHAVRRHQYFLLQDSGYFRENLYGLNRNVPSHIKQGQKVYPGRL